MVDPENAPKQEFKVYEYNLPVTLEPTKTALLVVDMQNDFIHPRGILSRYGLSVNGLDSFVKRVSNLIELCQTKGLPVIATRHIIRQDRRGKAAGGGLWVEMRPFLKTEGFRSGTWGAEIIEGLPPPDFIVEKTRFSAFYETGMERLLRDLRIEFIIFSGVATNVCVESTIRDAFFRDFRIITVEDCVTAYTQPAHEGSLHTLRFLGAVISLDDFRNLLNIN